MFRCVCVSRVIGLYLVSQEELCSDSVERIVVNPNAAYDKFKDKHVSTKSLGECGRFFKTHRLYVCGSQLRSCVRMCKCELGKFSGR